MTIEVFDLGMRLRALSTKSVQNRMIHAPIATQSSLVAVGVTPGKTAKISVSRYEAGKLTPSVSAYGLDGLKLIHSGSDNSLPGVYPTLVVASRDQLRLLSEAVMSLDPEGKLAVGALVEWAVQRSQHPGSTAITIISDACSRRWVTGAPQVAEANVSTWRSWLGVTSTGTDSLIDLARMVSEDSDPLEALAKMKEDDGRQWGNWLRRHKDGKSGWWRAWDSPIFAALGYQSRADAAELYERALLEDPIWQERLTHSGTVVRCTVESRPNVGQVRLVTDQPVTRYRPGADVCVVYSNLLQTPSSEDKARVLSLSATGDGKMMMTLSVPAKVASALSSYGTNISILPGRVDPGLQARGRGNLSKRLRNSDSWLVTGSSKPKIQRSVPLDVIIAAAE